MDDKVRMLVNIPCRVDYELKPTIEDLLAQADKPDLIDIFVYNQDPEDNQWKQSDFPSNVTLVNIEYTKTTNLSQGRGMVGNYIHPQHKYYLSIDAHMRFDKGWDSIMKNGLDAYKAKCIISAFPPGYDLTNGLHDNKDKFIVGQVHPESSHIVTSKFNTYSQPYPLSVIAGGYHFTHIEWLWEVGYDPYTDWGYHEIDLLLRSYTHGWDVVNIPHTPIYHNYTHENRKLEDHHEYNYGIDPHKRMKSKLQRKNLTYMEHKYALGDVRTLEDFNIDYGCNIFDKLVGNSK